MAATALGNASALGIISAADNFMGFFLNPFDSVPALPFWNGNRRYAIEYKNSW